jgi:putative transposase
MTRPIRVEYAGAVYHVMARGNEGRPIFRDDRDRLRFLVTVGEAVEDFGVRVYAYVLLSNHYHVLLGTPRGNLSQGWGWVQETYAVRFNHRHRRRGHLFQGRFKAELIDQDEYGRWLVEYLHLNPVRPREKGRLIPAERAEELARYEWSSHRDYAGLRKRGQPWLSLDWLRYWGRDVEEARSQYRRSIGRAFGRVAEGPWERLRGGFVLGGEDLWNDAQRRIRAKPGLEEAQWTRREDVGRLGERITEVLAGEPDRRIRVWVRVKLGGQRKVEAARAEGYRDGSAVTHLVPALEVRAAGDRTLRKKMENMRRQISSFKS